MHLIKVRDSPLLAVVLGGGGLSFLTGSGCGGALQVHAPPALVAGQITLMASQAARHLFPNAFPFAPQTGLSSLVHLQVGLGGGGVAFLAGGGDLAHTHDLPAVNAADRHLTPPLFAQPATQSLEYHAPSLPHTGASIISQMHSALKGRRGV